MGPLDQPLLYLASESPRRRDLLQRAGVPFELVAPGPEPDGDGPPARRAEQRARAKALGAAVRGPGPILEGPILGVDTVVDLDGEALGKAVDPAHAAATLQRLCGRTHLVHTAHCVVLWPTGAAGEEGAAPEVWAELATATVEFRAATAPELARYVASEQWRGKAGAYGIQDPGADFIGLRAGSLDTVVGLHLPAVRRLLACARGGEGQVR